MDVTIIKDPIISNEQAKKHKGSINCINFSVRVKF